MNVLFVVANLVLGIVIPLGLQLHDRGRLAPEQRAWVWNFASWGSALYNFGPLSLIAWGYVTRSPRYWRGLAVGVLLAEIALLLQGAAAEGLGRALSFKPKALAENREGFLATMVFMVALALAVGAGRFVHDLIRRWLGRSTTVRGPRAVALAVVQRERLVPPRPPGHLHHHEERQDGADRD